MKITSAQAAKLLSKLQQDFQRLSDEEDMSKDFLASVGENPESVRPRYDYAATRDRLLAVEQKIRAIKHALNRFNLTTTVPGFDMTIDEILVYIPQLSKRKGKLMHMASALPKARDRSYAGHSSNIIDYRYINYDLEEVRSDLDLVTDELSRAQLALDEVNHSAVFEVDP